MRRVADGHAPHRVCRWPLLPRRCFYLLSLCLWNHSRRSRDRGGGCNRQPPTAQVLTGPILPESSRAVTVQSRSVVQVRFQSREGATVEAQRTPRVPRSVSTPPAPDTVVALAATPAAAAKTRRAMAGTLGQPPTDVGAPWRHPLPGPCRRPFPPPQQQLARRPATARRRHRARAGGMTPTTVPPRCRPPT